MKPLCTIGGEKLLDFIFSRGSKLVGNSVVLPDLLDPMVIPDKAKADTGLPQALIRWGCVEKYRSGLIRILISGY